MPQIIFLPHAVLCPEGLVVDAAPGTSVLEVAHEHHIEIESACGGVCACTTCHCIIREGFDTLDEPDELEEDMLDKAWGLEANSRLSCQARMDGADLVIEIPKYTINHASEKHG